MGGSLLVLCCGSPLPRCLFKARLLDVPIQDCHVCWGDGISFCISLIPLLLVCLIYFYFLYIFFAVVIGSVGQRLAFLFYFYMMSSTERHIRYLKLSVVLYVMPILALIVLRGSVHAWCGSCKHAALLWAFLHGFCVAFAVKKNTSLWKLSVLTSLSEACGKALTSIQGNTGKAQHNSAWVCMYISVSISKYVLGMFI